MNFNKVNAALKKAFPLTLPVLAGYLILGFGFGMLLESKGFDWKWALMMSMFIYAGSMQYAGVSLLSGGVSLITTVLMTVMINARHLFYGISMLQRYRNTGAFKPYLIFSLTDETYSVLSNTEIPEDKEYFYFVFSLLNHLYWLTGSLLGSLFGAYTGFDSRGIDFSMTALFLVIITENILNDRTRLTSVLGIIISFICLLIFGSDSFLIPSMLFISLSVIILKSYPEGKEKDWK